MNQPTKAEPKEKDVNQIIRYLTTTFNRVTSKLEKATRTKVPGSNDVWQPNMAYVIQTEFAYLLNEIVQGPRCIMQSNIVACNEFLDQVVQELNREQPTA